MGVNCAKPILTIMRSEEIIIFLAGTGDFPYLIQRIKEVNIQHMPSVSTIKLLEKAFGVGFPGWISFRKLIVGHFEGKAVFG